MMKRRIFAALLSAAMVLSLAACGGKTGGGSSASNPGGSSSQPDGSQPGEVTLTLNKNEITLNKAGGTFQLKYTTDPEIDAEPTYTSSDESVATVDASGTITAVAPGVTTVMVQCGGGAVSAVVTCDWEDENTEPDTSKPEDNKPGGDTSKPEDNKPAASNVDLKSFYEAVTGKYEFGFLGLAESGILDQLYPGLTGIGTEQCLVYVVQISMNNGEFGLVQVKDSKDVDAVKAIFQARIDYMVGDGNGPGGAQYPMAMDSWEFNSRIVTNGNYIMMVVHENCDDIVKEFNALF